MAFANYLKAMFTLNPAETAILLNRLCICMKPNYGSLLHALLSLGVIPCAVLGLVCVLDSHKISLPPITNFSSLHSWIGLSTMAIYGFQIVIGFFSYFTYKTVDDTCCNIPTPVVRFHKLVETLDFILAIAACITGLSERVVRDDDSIAWSCEKIFKNCLGIAFLVSGFLFILFMKLAKS